MTMMLAVVLFCTSCSVLSGERVDSMIEEVEYTSAEGSDSMREDTTARWLVRGCCACTVPDGQEDYVCSPTASGYAEPPSEDQVAGQNGTKPQVVFCMPKESDALRNYFETATEAKARCPLPEAVMSCDQCPVRPESYMAKLARHGQNAYDAAKQNVSERLNAAATHGRNAYDATKQNVSERLNAAATYGLNAYETSKEKLGERLDEAATHGRNAYEAAKQHVKAAPTHVRNAYEATKQNVSERLDAAATHGRNAYDAMRRQVEALKSNEAAAAVKIDPSL